MTPRVQEARKRPSNRMMRVWVLTCLLAAGVAAGTWFMWDWTRIEGSMSIPWWVLGVMFYFAEMGVLHLRFRKDAYSFSMSEVPVVLGLLFAPPAALIVSQILGNAVVLAVHRRQAPVKYAFNIAQFGIQSIVAVVAYRAVLGSADPLAPWGWAAAIVATIAALVVADILINVVIRLSGGALSILEAISVFGLSVAATMMNTSLGLVAGIVMDAQPGGIWLGLAPAAVLFLAYRAYVSQREQGARFEALYEATRALHASPQIESSLAAATATARSIFEADFAEIVIFPPDEQTTAYRSTSGPGQQNLPMSAAGPEATDSMRAMLESSRGGLVPAAPPHPLTGGEFIDIKDAIVAPLQGGSGPVGIILVANRLGDVSTFDVADARMLETIASQVGVSLENGRLEDSLAELTELKDRLEGLVRSKDEFVASVSHELRTPLTAVLGLAEEIRANRSTLTDRELDEFMILIADQSSELSDLVEDLLVAGRADIGTLALKTGAVDLNTIVASLLANNASIAVTIAEVRGSCRPVLADPLRVRQILRNLITNAERYGGEKAWIELFDEDGIGMLRLIDDGDGVPEEAEAIIFNAYERAHNALSQPASVGLGLAVSRQLAQMMDGNLVYCHQDGLTTFTLTLPLAGPDDC
ncbi:MAG: GAF domain-containing sensor histidine kinase [Acidimicrobiia bacterium]|nr:GAF domain-containing sensor histidine kinase [Acidimicrobiia bacterium]